ncbi:MAG TPA: type I phosphomannose isomerase catalytic subunit, partial [Microbacteriaceae bacterium]|nr:type I phosphomannose isomerase catalytic subunit [Microbacteriaceae bacterium]
MFVRIGNTPRDYAWGSTSAIAELLGTAPSGKPEAELWLGAHA